MVQFTHIPKAGQNPYPFFLRIRVLYLLWINLCLPHPNSHAEALTPNVMAFGDGAFER